MSPPSQFVSSCMFLIFTVCAFTHLELVASDIYLLRDVCGKTRFTTHCKDILMSNPNTYNAPRINPLGLATVDLTLSSTIKARDKAQRLIGSTKDAYDVEQLKKCTTFYDTIAEKMRQAGPLMLSSWRHDEVKLAGYSCMGALASCERALFNVGSEIKNELAGMNKDIDNLIDIIQVIASF